MRVLHTVGARPNFMKAAPVIRALAHSNGISQVLIHTGQHYDTNMSEVFFRDLGLPEPDVNLGVGSGSHAKQTAEVMSRLEAVLLERKPELVLVYGDVNSTVAAALTCAKLFISVGHVESGLRSFDRTMPEEINRVVTDHVADLLFTPSADGNENLVHEGIDPRKIHLVGNVMIDTLMCLLPRAGARWLSLRVRLGIPAEEPYALVTLHRPVNVDDEAKSEIIWKTLHQISHDILIIFPVHPRTFQRLQNLRGEPHDSRICLTEPLGYLDFLALQRHAALVITDSGGIQEETTFLGIPCLTIRENTERPITLDLGTNTLVGQDMERLRFEVTSILRRGGKPGQIPPLWDGHAGERIAHVISGLQK